MLNIKRNAVSDLEVAVLNSLKSEVEIETDLPTTEIGEILTTTGMKDNDQVLRALYTLEGKSLVTPDPAGDFTSSRWRITNKGVQALGLLRAPN